MVKTFLVLDILFKTLLDTLWSLHLAHHLGRYSLNSRLALLAMEAEGQGLWNKLGVHCAFTYWTNYLLCFVQYKACGNGVQVLKMAKSLPKNAKQRKCKLLIEILPSSTLRTILAGPVKWNIGSSTTLVSWFEPTMFWNEYHLEKFHNKVQ